MKFVVATALTACLAAEAHAGAGQPLPFSDGKWTLTGDETKVVREGDREVLNIETGWAYRRDVRLENGTIDFDVRVTRRRSFVYLALRMTGDHDYEEFYLRPHKSGLPDAAQYAPVWQGQSAWQLHHGPGGTAAIEFEPGVWTHVRVVVNGRQAALFVGDLAKPALVVPRLAREPAAGYIAVRGFLPPGTPGSGPIVSYSNVVIEPGTPGFDFTSVLPPAKPAEPNAVRAWAVSRSFVPQGTDTATLPDAQTLAPFQKVDAEPGGLVELHRVVAMPKDAKLTAAVARVNVRAARAGTYAFDLGFSDVATVFVNGRPIFRGEGSYSADVPRREGLIGYDQARLYLPLVAGDNDVSILVSDGFGGWGLMGRFLEADDLQVEAR